MNKKDEKTKLNEELWDSRAGTYDRYFSFTRWTQKNLVSMLDLRKSPSLLDLACGTGWAVRYASSMANGQGKFYGVDNSSKMIKEAEASSENSRNVHFCKSNVEKLPFDDEFFDFVISSNAFHHFANPEKALREARRVLKPKGRIYILDTTSDNFFMRTLDRFSRRFESAHVKIYSTREFRVFFEKAGLRYMGGRALFIPFLRVHTAEKLDRN